MKKLISIVVALATFSSACFADCDFSKLVHNPDGTVTYPKDAHVCVGQLVQDDKTKTQQVTDLNKAVSLKDLAIKTSDERTQNWMDTSLKLEKNVQEIDQTKKQNEWLYFALGVLVTGMAGITAAQLSRTH